MRSRTRSRSSADTGKRCETCWNGRNRWTGLAALRGVIGVCDHQVQAVLSRYRLMAVGRLVQMATEGEGELARKACVDLLKLELKRVPMDVKPAGDEDLEPLPDGARAGGVLRGGGG